MFIYLSNLNSAEIGSTERMPESWKSARNPINPFLLQVPLLYNIAVNETYHKAHLFFLQINNN